MSLQTKLEAGVARDRLRSLSGRSLDLLRQLGDEVQAAKAYSDPRLSPQGLAEKQNELQQAARTRVQGEVVTLRAEAKRDLQTLRAFAEEDRPRSGSSELRQQRLWDRTRQLLDAGRSLREVIAQTDDVDTLLAIREEGPVWMQSQVISEPGMTGQRTEPDVDGLLRTVDQRLAQTTDGLAAVALSWGMEATALEAQLRPVLDYLQSEAAGTAWDGQGLESAVASRLGEQEARRGLLDDGPVTAA